ncbi:hypothetical protein GCM10009665_10870 [Kitasatospora nipponensis]|uniref:Uncharacterized protein n=1 Tax=Kitasatospora nipponensis TaxID=258049 RepID=A0ABP4GEB8_9ACTN
MRRARSALTGDLHAVPELQLGPLRRVVTGQVEALAVGAELEAVVRPGLVGAAVAVPQLDRGPVGGAVPVDVQAGVVAGTGLRAQAVDLLLGGPGGEVQGAVGVAAGE